MGDCTWRTRTGMGLSSILLCSFPFQTPPVHVDSSSLPVQDIDGKQILQFYWIDAYEEPSIPGTVFLFGKVGVAGGHVSCCVIVKNIQRCMYVLPRKKVPLFLMLYEC